LAQLPEEAVPTPTPRSRPDVAVSPPAPRTEAKTPVETAAIVRDGRSPFEELEGAGGNVPAPARAEAAVAATKTGDRPGAAGAPVARAAGPTLPALELANSSEALRADPGEADAYINCGNAWWTRREYDQALADYSEALRLNPGHATAYSNRAVVWAAKG